MPNLFIDVEARFSAFQDGLDKISRQVDKSAKNWDRAFSGLGSALATLGITASAAGLVAFAKSGIDAADDIGKLAQKVGVTTESLSAMQYAAKLSDVSNEQLATGLSRLARAASDAASGSKESAEAFQALGVNVKDSNGNLRSTEDLLLDIADRFSKMEDGAGKTALAMRIFGRAGAEMIPFLNQGRTGFEELRKEAEKLGIVISRETAKAAEDFNDNMTRLGTAIGSAKHALAEQLLPTLTRVAQEMADAAREGQGLIGVMKALAGLSPFGDLQKAQKELVDLTDRIMLGERRLAEMTRTPLSEPTAKALEERIAADTKRANELIKLLGVLRGETDAFGDPKKPTPETKKERAPTLPDSGAIAAAKKAAEELERERTRLRKLGNDEWVKFIDEQIAQEKELALVAHKTALEREKDTEELLRKGRDGWIAYAEAVFQAADEENLALAKIAEEANKTSDVARELGLTFSSAFEDAGVNGKKFGDVLRGLAQDIARLVIRKSVTEPLAAAGSKLLNGLDFGKVFGKLFGAAQGGSFMVGGSGGTDSQLVAFKASPNERVTIETPEQQRSGGGNSFNFSIDARGAETGVEQRIQRAVREAVQVSLQMVQSQADRGGSFARAVGRR